MGWVETVLIAIGLSVDACAVSLGAAGSGQVKTWAARLRMAFCFGFFQAAMPIIGFFLGALVADYIKSVDHFIACGLLAFVGGKMIYEAITESEEDEKSMDPSRGVTLLILGIATSIDALAVGLSYAMIGDAITGPAIAIGCITFILSLAGLLLGNRLNAAFGKRMEICGGLVLIGLGLKILIEHLIEGI